MARIKMIVADVGHQYHSIDGLPNVVTPVDRDYGICIAPAVGDTLPFTGGTAALEGNDSACPRTLTDGVLDLYGYIVGGGAKNSAFEESATPTLMGLKLTNATNNVGSIKIYVTTTTSIGVPFGGVDLAVLESSDGSNWTYVCDLPSSTQNVVINKQIEYELSVPITKQYFIMKPRGIFIGNHLISEIEVQSSSDDFGIIDDTCLDQTTGNVYKKLGYKNWTLTYSPPIIPDAIPTSYTDQSELIAAVGATKGVSVSVDTEPGNTYVRNNDDTKWIVPNNNTYVDGIGPDIENFDVALNTQLINSTTGKKYLSKNVIPTCSAKSVQFNFADNHGDGSSMGMRGIQFWLGDEQVAYDVTWAISSTTNAGDSYLPVFLFDGSSNAGARQNQSWISSGATNQCVVVTFPENIIFDTIKYVNYHDNGSLTSKGVKSTVVKYSPTEAFESTWGSTLGDEVVVFNIDFLIHTGGSVATYRTLIFTASRLWVIEDVDVVPQLISYADKTTLLASIGATKGVVATVDSEPGNIYVRNPTNTKWIPSSGNMYLIGDMPTSTEFELSYGLAYVNKTNNPPSWVYDDGI